MKNTSLLILSSAILFGCSEKPKEYVCTSIPNFLFPQSTVTSLSIDKEKAVYGKVTDVYCGKVGNYEVFTGSPVDCLEKDRNKDVLYIEFDKISGSLRLGMGNQTSPVATCRQKE